MLRKIVMSLGLILIVQSCYSQEKLERRIVEVADGCGKISIALPEWVSMKEGGLRVNKDFPGNMMSSLRLIYFCVNIDSNVFMNSLATYNQRTQRWEKNPKNWSIYSEEEIQDIKDSISVQEIKVENGSGWLATQIAIAGETGYDKRFSFCLKKNGTEKALCGGGVVQELEYKDDKRNDFTEMMTGFIKSIKFLDDEQSTPSAI